MHMLKLSKKNTRTSIDKHGGNVQVSEGRNITRNEVVFKQKDLQVTVSTEIGIK